MKILFHPSYDSGYYINVSKVSHNILGTKIVGIMGLLDHLSLHNGLSGRFASDGERASAFLAHVGKNAKGSMIETSFKNDALGVAKCLLHWRDVLIMSGWRPNQSGDDSTPKLQLLCQIEESWRAQLKGSADRWLELATLSKNQCLLEKDDTIECRCSKESLPRIVQDVLVSCKASFVDYSKDIYTPDKEKIKVLRYNDLSDAYRQVAAHIDDYKDTVIINRDNVTLNHVLLSWGKPLVGATIKESNPLTLQLFKLALSVFSRPLNIQNLLSYLLLPIGPVPGKLRYSLANVLTNEGGFGKIEWDELKEEKRSALKEAHITNKWGQCIFDYINEDEDTETEGRQQRKVQRESKTTLLKYITDSTLTKDKNIPVETLQEYIHAFNQWASPIAFTKEEAGESNDDEMMKSQLATVVSYFKQLSDALSGTKEISYQDLERLVRTIYQPSSITQAHAQVGSLQVINSYEQIVDTPDNLLWLDCCGADMLSDLYEFLSTTEREWLIRQTNITIPRLGEILELNRKEMINSLSKITGTITLVTSDYHHNQKMSEHPLIAELKMQMGDEIKIEDGCTNLPLSTHKDIKKIEPKLKYELGEINYGGRSESNTSIDTLINYPFDYTVQYIARLREPSKKELGSTQKIMGLVAHNFVENLVTDVSELPKQERIARMESLLEQEYESRLEEAINTTGLSLLLKENEVDYNNLRFLLKQSIEGLIKIMKKKELTPVGCELKYDKPLGKEINEFNARVDMELEDLSGQAVIFDFKWSYAKYYGEKIKEGTAIQLELYRRELLAQGKNVSAVGYYLFPKCVLETPDYDTLKEDGKVLINHIEPPHDVMIFEQIQNSIIQRRQELQEGNVEEGEGMNIKELPYSRELLEGRNMLTVGKIKRGRVTKNNPDPAIESIDKDSKKVYTTKNESRFIHTFVDFSNNASPLNETPTTYPLMKGRLK